MIRIKLSKAQRRVPHRATVPRYHDWCENLMLSRFPTFTAGSRATCTYDYTILWCLNNQRFINSILFMIFIPHHLLYTCVCFAIGQRNVNQKPISLLVDVALKWSRRQQVTQTLSPSGAFLKLPATCPENNLNNDQPSTVSTRISEEERDR